MAELGVVAGGAWSVTASPLLEAATLNSTYSGHGDDLLLLTGSGGRLEMTHNGDSNFAVVAWGDGGRDLLVNELGAYSGTARLDSGTGLLTITADGSWTMTVDQAG